MDSARYYYPNNILLWRNVADHPEAQRILRLFSDSQVEVIEKQKLSAASIHSATLSPLPNKKILMIGETQSFVNRFTGSLGSSVHCCPYYKLVPVSNGCPYACSYCYLAYIYRTHSPFIKINLNTDTMFK
jgi:tRNA A37 methylthiotransferase MiaB